jgi:DNA glycosylase AlkZ-like
MRPTQAAINCKENMTTVDIAQQRLQNQRLSSTTVKKPADLVKWLGAVQAQDFQGAKWAVGQRLHDATDASVEKAFNEGTFLRTHVMRPTWHFVAPSDIRWLLELGKERTKIINNHHYRKLELDESVFKQTNRALTNALRGGKQLTRDQLRDAVRRAGIEPGNALRFVYIVYRAELEGIICSGPRKGKHFTYALLEERVPSFNALKRDEALAELARRYFTSHGPATLQDFVWWSGLTMADAKTGLEMIQMKFSKKMVEGKTYWFSSDIPAVKAAPTKACLLPPFDEYLIGYKDRTAAFGRSQGQKTIQRNPVFNSPVVLGGRVVGGWTRILQHNSVRIEVTPFDQLNKSEWRKIKDAGDRYAAFLGMSAVFE